MARDSLEDCRRSRLWLCCASREGQNQETHYVKVVNLKVRASNNSIRWSNSLRLKVKAKTP